jgi:hypothetical protein
LKNSNFTVWELGEAFFRNNLNDDFYHFFQSNLTQENKKRISIKESRLEKVEKKTKRTIAALYGLYGK